MILGVIMLCAISYVTLSTGESPFHGIRKHVNPVMAWGWAIASLLANMVWVLPQYSLAYGAITENLFPNMIEDPSADGPKYLVSFVLLGITTAITFCYGSKGSSPISANKWIKASSDKMIPSPQYSTRQNSTS